MRGVLESEKGKTALLRLDLSTHAVSNRFSRRNPLDAHDTRPLDPHSAAERKKQIIANNLNAIAKKIAERKAGGVGGAGGMGDTGEEKMSDIALDLPWKQEVKKVIERPPTPSVPQQTAASRKEFVLAQAVTYIQKMIRGRAIQQEMWVQKLVQLRRRCAVLQML